MSQCQYNNRILYHVIEKLRANQNAGKPLNVHSCLGFTIRRSNSGHCALSTRGSTEDDQRPRLITLASTLA